MIKNQIPKYERDWSTVLSQINKSLAAANFSENNCNIVFQ
jgi:hypothetical protein